MPGLTLPRRLRAAALASLSLAALVSVSFVAACGEQNPNFCEGAGCTEIDAAIDAAPITCDTDGPDPTCPAGTPICVSGECTGMCASDADCVGRPVAESICHVPSGACVTCDESNMQALPSSTEDDCPGPTTAVCDATSHTCRACTTHSECFSGVCDAGRCAPPAEVIYMTTGGSDGGNNCDNPAPTMGCLTLNFAISKLTATRKYIHMAPSATPYAARNNTDRADFNGDTAHVIGYGAEVRRIGADGEVIEVRGGSNVLIEGLTVANATNPGSGAGIKVDASRLELFKARIQNNAYVGIIAGGTNASLRVTRTTISGNDGGGILATNVPFVLVNNFLVNNGDAASLVAGLSVSSAGATSVLEFNTIVDNNGDVGISDVNCTNSMVIARNNIINGIATKPRVNGNCTHRNTLYGPDGTIAGTANTLVADRDMYRFIGSGNYHLDPAANPASVAVGAADSTSLLGEALFDFDSQARVSGAATVDVGADEIP